MASKLGFQQVIGVEFARELVDIARTNLAKMRISKAVVRHGDAAEFHFPEYGYCSCLISIILSRKKLCKKLLPICESRP